MMQDIHNIVIGNALAKADHGGEAGLELVTVQEAVAVGVEAAKHLLDGRSELRIHSGGHDASPQTRVRASTHT